MRSKLTAGMLLFALFGVLSLFAGNSGLAQDGPTATPGGIVSLQGTNNTGLIQPLTISQVIAQVGGLQDWRNRGWTGRGIRVGVLDLGFRGVLDFQSFSGANIRTVTFGTLPDYNQGVTTHGTSVIEVIHGIAPDVEFVLCTYATLNDFTACIDDMIRLQVDIVNHSAGVPALPLNGNNAWALEVDRAARADILWVNAAGNFANGRLEDLFTDTNNNTYHEFRGQSGIVETLGVTSSGQARGRVLLSWRATTSRPAKAIDLDLEIVDDNDNVIASSLNIQEGRPADSPLEFVQFDMDESFGVRVRAVNIPSESVEFVLFVEFASLPGAQAIQSIIAPADSSSALTVVALQNNVLAPYTSRGPLISGVQKPDLAAPGEIILSDNTIFVGTSAAAPVVAGAAALLLQEDPTLTEFELRLILQINAQDDREFPGNDTNYGYGRLSMPLIERNAPIPTATSLPTATPTVMPTSTASPTMTASATIAPTRRNTNTPTLTLTATTESTNTSEPTDPIVIVNNPVVNLRSGPGTNYGIVGSAEQGEQFDVVAYININGGWFLVRRLGGNVWIAASIVELVGLLGEVPAPATIPPSPVPTRIPATPTPAFNTPPRILNARTEGTCASFEMVVDWEDPDGDLQTITYGWADGTFGTPFQIPAGQTSGTWRSGGVPPTLCGSGEPTGGECRVRVELRDSSNEPVVAEAPIVCN